MQSSKEFRCVGRKSADFWSILLHERKYYASLGASRGKDERTTRHCTPVLLPVRVYVSTLPSCCSWGVRVSPISRGAMMTVEIVLYNEKGKFMLLLSTFPAPLQEEHPQKPRKRTPRIVIHEYPSVENDESRPVNHGMNLFPLLFYRCCVRLPCMKATAQILFCLRVPLPLAWKSGSDKVHQMDHSENDK